MHIVRIGKRIHLLNRKAVTSAFQDSPLSFIKPWSLSFGFNPIFVKYLQSTAKPNSDQMSANKTSWHSHSSWQEGERTSIYWHRVSHSLCAPSSQRRKHTPDFTCREGKLGPERLSHLLNTLPPLQEKWGELGLSDFKASVLSTVLGLLLASIPQRSSFSRICKNAIRV